MYIHNKFNQCLANTLWPLTSPGRKFLNSVRTQVTFATDPIPPPPSLPLTHLCLTFAQHARQGYLKYVTAFLVITAKNGIT